MTCEQLADALQEQYPDAEPFETPWPVLETWLRDAGVDPDDGDFVTQVLQAWDVRCV